MRRSYAINTFATPSVRESCCFEMRHYGSLHNDATGSAAAKAAAKRALRPPIADAAAAREEDLGAESSASGSSDTTSRDNSDGSVCGDEETRLDRNNRPPHAPMTVLGQRVTGELRLDDARGNNYVRLRVNCNNPAHGVCRMSRVLSKGVERHGARACEAAMGAWLMASHRVPASQHRRKYEPSDAEIQAYLAAHPDPA